METNEKTVMSENDKSSKKQINYKEIIVGIILVAAVALVIVLGSYNSSVNRLSRQLDLGQKYLEEQNYEQAIAAFNEVIEIDPMSVDAYLGLADAYIGIGDTESAICAVENGIELTQDERLVEALELLKGDTSIVNQNDSENFQMNEGLDNIYLFETLDDLAVDILSQLGTVGEFNFVGASYDEFTRYLIDNYNVEENKDGTHVDGYINDNYDGGISAGIGDITTIEDACIGICDGHADLGVTYYKNYISYKCRLSNRSFDDYSEPKILNFPLLYQDWDEFFAKYVPWQSSETEEGLWYTDEIELIPDYHSSSKTWVFQDQSVNAVHFNFSEFEDSSLNNRYIRIDTTGSYMNGANHISINFHEGEDVRYIDIRYDYYSD